MQLEDFQHYKSRDYVEISCTNCNKPTKKQVRRVRESIRKGTNLFCGQDCISEYLSVTRFKQIETTCFTCGENISVIPSALNERNYCSRSCAAVTNNRISPKRTKLPRLCERCGGSTSRPNIKVCRECRKEEKHNVTIGEIRSYYIKGSNKRLGSISHTIATRVRKHARTLAAEQAREKVCKVCGYDTYVELCHIKPISEFPDDATLLEINGAHNTVYLCPNHHKELDLGLLRLI